MLLGVGIIGYGFIGKVHAFAYRTLPYFYEELPVEAKLVGVATSRPETAERAKAHGGFEFATSEVEALLEHEDIQLIHVCTPNALHLAHAGKALEAGKHVYCDKPLGATWEEARKLHSLAVQSGRVHQVTFQYRFVPALLEAWRLVKAGFLGRPVSFRLHYLHSGYLDPQRPTSWRLQKALAGGGALYDLGAHVFDLLIHLLGEVESVRCATETFVKERPKAQGSSERVPVDVDDWALAAVKLQNGAWGSVEASRVATGSHDDLRVELHGSEGALRFSLLEPNWLEVYEANSKEAGFKRVGTMSHYPPPASRIAQNTVVGWERFHIASVYDFLENVAVVERGWKRSQPKALSPDFEAGLKVQRVLEAAQRSAASGASVELAEVE